MTGDIEAVAAEIVDGAIQVHSALGPGLLESVYQTCLAYELAQRGLHVAQEVPLPVHYHGIRIDMGYRMDMIVGGHVLVENKCVAELLPVRRAQVITYLKLASISIGFLINWNVPLIKDGIRRLSRG